MEDSREKQFIPFGQIPGSSPLFLDFLSDSNAVSKYFSREVRSDGSDFPDETRRQLNSILARQNRKWNCSAKTIQNLELLSRKETVAVVSGQQAGLFGGPILTLYKALSAIAKAEELTRGGVQAVPVFWIASEDHDIAEAAHTWFIQGASVSALKYQTADDFSGRSIDEIRLEEKINDLINQFSADLFATVSGREYAALLRDAWQPGTKFTTHSQPKWQQCSPTLD